MSSMFSTIHTERNYVYLSHPLLSKKFFFLFLALLFVTGTFWWWTGRKLSVIHANLFFFLFYFVLYFGGGFSGFGWLDSWWDRTHPLPSSLRHTHWPVRPLCLCGDHLPCFPCPSMCVPPALTCTHACAPTWKSLLPARLSSLVRLLPYLDLHALSACHLHATQCIPLFSPFTCILSIPVCLWKRENSTPYLLLTLH